MALVRTDTDAYLQVTMGYTFINLALLTEALDTTGLRSSESNQRLAMLGDALLKHALLDDWYSAGAARGKWALVARYAGYN